MKNGLMTLIGDRRRYSLEKAMRLLLESNPNIVGLLWLREEEYVHRHPAFDVLRSQAAAEAFAGSRPGAWRSYADHPEGWENPAHLIRLLRMGNEFITTGTLHVFRTSDADELKVIKRGGWTLDQVKAEAERLFSDVEAARARSPLPPDPDVRAANELLITLHRQFLGF